MPELYIDGQLCDLSPETVIAVTKQVNNIADIESKFGDLTNEFSLPFTKNNDLIFGFSKRVESGSSSPYQKLTAKFVDNGVEIIMGGYASLNSAKTDYKLVVYSNNSSFFQDIKNKRLQDLDLSDLNHTWGLSAIHTSRTNTTGYKYSIIDYGKMFDVFGDVILTKELFPSFFAHYLVEKIISGLDGWTVEGAVLEQELYQKLKLDWSNDNWERPKSETDLYLVNTKQSEGVDQTMVYIRDSESGIPALYYPYPLEASDDNVYQNFEYVVPFDVRLNLFIDLALSWEVTGNATGTSGLIHFQVFNETQNSLIIDQAIVVIDTFTASSGVYPETPVSILGNGHHQALNELVEAGDVLQIRLGINGEFDIEVVVNKFELKIEANKAIGQDEYFVLQNQLPDITQGDFLIGVMNIFGIVPISNSFNKTIEFRRFQELGDNIPSAIDMSEFYIDSPDGDDIQFRAEGYGQVNNLKWDQDENVLTGLGDSSFDIADELLPEEIDVVKSIFGASEMIVKDFPDGTFNAPLINKVSYDDDGNLVIESTSIRLSIDDTQNSSFAITYSDGTNINTFSTSVPFCYFILPNKEINLDWAFLKEEYYSVLVQILQNYKKISPIFTLKAPEVQALDHFVPWYISKYSANFFPMKISDYKDNRPTVVELIKI